MAVRNKPGLAFQPGARRSGTGRSAEQLPSSAMAPDSCECRPGQHAHAAAQLPRSRCRQPRSPPQSDGWFPFRAREARGQPCPADSNTRGPRSRLVIGADRVQNRLAGREIGFSSARLTLMVPIQIRPAPPEGRAQSAPERAALPVPEASKADHARSQAWSGTLPE